jgi:hypothetical protein
MTHAVTSRRFAQLVLVAIVIGIVSPRDAHADAFDVRDTSWEGNSELLEIARAELGSSRVVAVGVLNWDEVGPDDGVLAIHPLQAMDADETTSFMKAGGRLAILDDYGLGEETLRRFKIERIAAPSRPVAALRNKPSLAIAEPVTDVVAGHNSGPHPVVAHVQQLVTNHPTGLRHPNLSPVLKIRAIGEPDVIIAVAGQVGKGRLFAMSDPSATINEMLRYPGNRAFVSGLARYLVDEDSGKKGRLFIVANRFDEEGAYGGKGTLRKDLDTQLKAIANAIADARRDGLPSWMHVTVAVLAALGVAAWVARSSARPYKSVLPRYARRVPLVAQGGLAGRFALLAAPSSPRSLALLELKSALLESLADRFDLGPEPGQAAVLAALDRSKCLDASLDRALRDLLARMNDVEAAVVGGNRAAVPKPALAQAATIVHDVLAAAGIGPLESARPAPRNEANIAPDVQAPPSAPEPT